jgi:serine O-acetyltransferase
MALLHTTDPEKEKQLPVGIIGRMREDVQAVFDRDPAARTALEVTLAYPGLHAIWMYRAAHWLWEQRLYLLARLLSELARWITGIEIHPGATIGRRFFIDHGMGVVIGETAEIGDDVLIYQGVTLGGTSLKKEKRHPTIEDHVMISAGAAVIGPVRIGRGSRIGAGAVVISSAPPYSTIVGIPGKVIEGESTRQDVAGLDHVHLPDPVARAMQGLVDKLNRIGVRMEELEERQDCLEDAVNTKIASNVSPSAPPNVSLEVAPNASPGVADAPAAADGPTLPDDSALPKDR